MTSEQIVNLRRRLNERSADGEGINVTREDVTRLLDERETLLRALRSVARLRHCDEPGCTNRGCCAAALANAARREAESP